MTLDESTLVGSLLECIVEDPTDGSSDETSDENRSVTVGSVPSDREDGSRETRNDAT